MTYAPLTALGSVIEAHAYRPIFTALCGDHLHGIARADSPLVVRGAHLLPLHDVLGLFPMVKTLTSSVDLGGTRLELVSHDLKKFLTLLSNKNGFVVEELYAPLLITFTPALVELRELCAGALNRHQVYNHYRGAIRNLADRWDEWHETVILLRLLSKLLLASHLLLTGQMQGHLPTLAPHLPGLCEVIALYRAAQPIPVAALSPLVAVLPRLDGELDAAYACSALPDRPRNLLALNDFLLRMRGES